MTRPEPERWTDEIDARLRWFAEIQIGDVRQWSGPNEYDPRPGMAKDIRAALAEVARLRAEVGRARAAGLEEAARYVAGLTIGGPNGEYRDGMVAGGAAAVVAIRQLAARGADLLPPAEGK